MNFKPILFSTEMVRAILDGRKHQTRRIVKPQPLSEHVKDGVRYFKIPSWPNLCEKELIERLCRWSVGDVLWVREEHYRYGKWVKNGETPTGRQKWKFVADPHFIEIRYFDNPPTKIEKNNYRGTGWYKRLARFMPKSACRTFLEITDRKIERVQDISEEDAVCEGVWLDRSVSPAGYTVHGMPHWPTAREAFKVLWSGINGEPSWEQSPWIWCITFKRIDKPSTFGI